jgi:hypothetical protein
MWKSITCGEEAGSIVTAMPTDAWRLDAFLKNLYEFLNLPLNRGTVKNCLAE